MAREASHGTNDDFHLFTTFRLDSALVSNATHTAFCGGIQTGVYLLPFHFDRLKGAAATLGGFNHPEAMSNLATLEREVQYVSEDAGSQESTRPPGPGDEASPDVVRRGKISWWPSGRLETTLFPVAQTSPNLLPQSFGTLATPEAWTVVLDDRPTEMSLYTEIKTSERAVYDRARRSATLDATSNTEVLLHNYEGEIMDGSITTVYFYRNNKWVTPHAGSLKGVTRRYALENELCSIADPAIRADSLEEGETVLLSNAFRGFFTATFCKR